MSSNSKGRMLLNEKTFRDLGSESVMVRYEIKEKQMKSISSGRTRRRGQKHNRTKKKKKRKNGRRSL